MAGCFDRVCEPYARGTSPSLKAMYNDPRNQLADKCRQVVSMFMMNTKRLVVFLLVTLCMRTFAGFAEQPTGSGILPEILSEFGNQRLAEMGCVDVTAEPFSYARDHQMVCFFPPGEYKVSDTLNCEQYRPMRGDGRRKGTRDYPCVLVGSRRDKRRPRIVLLPHSSGYNDPSRPKYVVHFWSPGMGTETPVDQPQPNISMNQMLVSAKIIPVQWRFAIVAHRDRAYRIA